MELWKTDKTDLTTDEIETYIKRHEVEYVPRYDKLWDYYLAKNPTILSRKKTDPNNQTPFGYGRKIVKTYTGYAYRPGYITYKESDETDDTFMQALMDNFKSNTETIKTERTGRNTAIFGLGYELHYIKGIVDSKLTQYAEPRFYNVDPRQIILLYDSEPEPGKAMAIRYYRVDEKTFHVELYLKYGIRLYTRTQNDGGKWIYALVSEMPNFYEDIPISAYYMGDEAIGLIDPVSSILDDFDILVSDSMVEFQRFANAYLRVVGASLGDPTGQNPKLLRMALERIKSSRVFDRLKDKEDVSFLTKDIPQGFIDFMTKLLRDQIHEQSHVPDFGSDKFSGALSGAAIQRMMFDFENLTSDAEADFNIGLYDRIQLIGTIFNKVGIPETDVHSIIIRHRRNIPIDEGAEADEALKMRNAGLSMETTLENMPREIVPDIEEELRRQESEMASAMPDIDMTPDTEIPEEEV